MSTLRLKLVLLTMLAMIVGAVVIGFVDHAGKRDIAHDLADRALKDEARLLLDRVQESLRAVAADGRRLADAAATERVMPGGVLGVGIGGGASVAAPTAIASAASTFPGAFAPYSEPAERAELGRLLAAEMLGRPAYLSLRLLSVEGGMIHARRDGDAIVTTHQVPPAALAAELTARAGALPDDGWSFSEARFLGPGGAGPRVISLVAPVADGTGRRLGLVEMEVDFPRLIAEAMRLAAPSTNSLIVSRFGDFVAYGLPMAGGAARVETGFDPALAEESDADTALLSAAWRALFGDHDDLLAVSRASESMQGLPALTAVVGQSSAAVFAGVRDSLRHTLTTAAGLLAATLLASALAVTRLTRPLTHLAETMRLAPADRALALPTARRDEVGVLARAIDEQLSSLRDSREQATAVMNSLADALIVIDAQGRVLEYSPSAERMLGWRAEEVVGRNVKMLMPSTTADQHDDHLSRFRESGRSDVPDRVREVEAQTRDGRLMPVELAVSVVKRDDRTAFVGILRDVTARRQAEAMKNAFISTVNHELRTPLTSIRAALAMIEQLTQGKLEPKPARLVTLARTSSDRLSKLVDDILDLERMAAGVMPLNMERLELRALTREVVERHEPLADRFGVSFVPPLDGPPIWIYADGARYAQSLANLLANAAKFSPEGGEVVCAISHRPDGRARVSVSDQGPGVPEDFRPRIFERFAQARPHGEREGGGSGLGLSIARDIIRAFGGEVGFESHPGRGAVFYFDLPILSEGDDERSLAGRDDGPSPFDEDGGARHG